MKILYMTNYPAPYKVDFFNELGKHCDLTVTFEEEVTVQKHRNQNWFRTNYDNFNAIFLKSTLTQKGHTKLSLQIMKYISQEWDYVIVGMYSTYTAMLAMHYMIIHNKAYWIATDGGIAKDGKGVAERIKSYFLSHACGYFSPSKGSDEYLMFYGASKEKIYRYPFTSIFEKDILQKPYTKKEKINLREKLGITEQRVVVGVGQFIHRKGWDLLIKCSKDFLGGIYIIGGIPTQDYIELKSSLKASNVHFLDFMSYEKLKLYYLAADVFVMPTREDIWGLVINEAMANGIPVITTNKCVAGVEMILNGKNGYLIETENENVLKVALTNFFENDRNSGFEVEALNTARRFSIEKMTEAYLNSLKKNEKNIYMLNNSQNSMRLKRNK